MKHQNRRQHRCEGPLQNQTQPGCKVRGGRRREDGRNTPVAVRMRSAAPASPLGAKPEPRRSSSWRQFYYVRWWSRLRSSISYPRRASGYCSTVLQFSSRLHSEFTGRGAERSGSTSGSSHACRPRSRRTSASKSSNPRSPQMVSMLQMTC